MWRRVAAVPIVICCSKTAFLSFNKTEAKIITASSSGQVDVQVWHKNTKTMVEAQRDVTISGSKVILVMPNLTPIATLPQDLDTVLIGYFMTIILKWEYVATWSTESTNINNTFKQWDEVTPVAPQWIQL
jgi:hypothetical protein